MYGCWNYDTCFTITLHTYVYDRGFTYMVARAILHRADSFVAEPLTCPTLAKCYVCGKLLLLQKASEACVIILRCVIIDFLLTH